MTSEKDKVGEEGEEGEEGEGGNEGGGQLYQYIQCRSTKATLKFTAPSHPWLPLSPSPSHPHCDMSGAQEILNVLVLLPHLHFQPPPLCSLEITLTRDSVHLLLQLQDLILQCDRIRRGLGLRPTC